MSEPILVLSRRERRRLRDERLALNFGKIVARPGHRCHPPGSSEFARDWKIDHTGRFPEGTVWECPCGERWRSAYGHFDRGLWLIWTTHGVTKAIERSEEADE